MLYLVSSLSQSLRYMAGLIAICFLHFSCGSLDWSTLGVGPQALSSSETNQCSDTSSNKCQELQGIDIYCDGQAKGNLPDKILKHGLIEKIGLMHQYGFGNDACFYNVTEQCATLVVADGVGISCLSGEFARMLVKNIGLSSSTDPRKKVYDGYAKTFAEWDNLNANAASTVCVACIYKGYVDIAWIGDAKVMVLRRGKVLFQTEDGVYRFNKPYQLMISRYDKQIKKGQLFYKRVELEDGDIVFTSSDGVFDNFHDDNKEIRDIVNVYKSSEEMLSILLERVLENSKSKDKPTNFAKKSNEAGRPYTGGKEDDMSAIIAIYKSSDFK